LWKRKNRSGEAKDECAESMDFHLCLSLAEKFVFVDGQKVGGVTAKDNRLTKTLYSLRRTEGFSTGTLDYPEMVGPLKWPVETVADLSQVNLTARRLEVSPGTPG
jgi:hypothetical protein